MQVTHIIRALPVVLGVASVAAAQQGGQRFRVIAQDAWFHQEAAGRRLARLVRGITLPAAEGREGWVRVTLEGWIWSASVGPSQRSDFDLLVTRGPEENLRATAGGTILARLAQGFGLHRIGASGRWVHVRRDGWVPRAALQPLDPEPAVASGGDTTRPAAPTGSTPRAQPASNATLYRAPDGPEAGTLAAATPVRVLSRTGEWARVQLEAWVKADELQTASSGVLVGVSAAELRTEPQRYAGQVLRWRLEFIALQQADELRPDIPPGATYALARGPLPERGFVYMVVPEAKLAAIRALAPLAMISVTARVRTGRSRYLGNPVVELIALEPSGTPGRGGSGP